MSGSRENDGIAPWVPVIGGIALGAGILACLYFFAVGKKSEEKPCNKEKTDIGEDGASSDSDGDGLSAWLPIIGGVALGAGLLALLYKLLFGNSTKCPTISPNRRRWPDVK